MAGCIAILGATGGVGRALAARVAARGLVPLLIGRDAEALARLADSLPGALTAVADATDTASLRAALATPLPGPLSGLAYAVGSIQLKPLARVTEAEMLQCFHLNTVGAAMAVQAAAPALAEAGGSVVLFSSVAARYGFAQHSIISAAKAGVEGLALALAAELAPKVRVNCIAPSLVRTGMAEGMTRNAQMAEAIARLHPIPRLGEAEDVAALADFLLSPAAGWITGQVMGVDGGRGPLKGKG